MQSYIPHIWLEIYKCDTNTYTQTTVDKRKMLDHHCQGIIGYCSKQDFQIRLDT